MEEDDGEEEEEEEEEEADPWWYSHSSSQQYPQSAAAVARSEEPIWFTKPDTSGILMKVEDSIVSGGGNKVGAAQTSNDSSSSSNIASSSANIAGSSANIASSLFRNNITPQPKQETGLEIDMDQVEAQAPLPHESQAPQENDDLVHHRHPFYYFEDGNMLFLVEDCLYKLHRGILRFHSGYFCDRFPDGGAMGGENRYQLDNTKSIAFERLLRVIYPLQVGEELQIRTLDEWSSILELATR